ncbi:MAG: RimK family alpha-L-glutamate ligase [Gaiellales bacterium]
MRILIVSDTPTPTDLELRSAFARHGVDADVVRERDVLREARPGDAALGRVDVLPSLDGTSGCIWTLRKLEDHGIHVLNGVGALLAAHDKLVTALKLGRAGIPHPVTAHVDDGAPLPSFAYPVVVKPRFGSWGRDVVACDSAGALADHLQALRRRRWFRRQGALVQELVPPVGRDLRVIVAGAEIAGAIERVAAPGEWRTNVALGASRRRVAHLPPEARRLALAAAEVVDADLVGVDLLPTASGYTVLELNGAVSFNRDYSLAGSCVFDTVARALVATIPATREPATSRVTV